MRKYVLGRDGKQAKSEFITEVVDMGDGTLDVHFADGSVYHRVSYNENNLKKIKDIMETQASRGVENYSSFSIKTKVSKCMSFVVPLVVFSGTMSTITDQELESDPIVVATKVGLVTVLSAIPMGIKFIKDKRTSDELKKIDYCNSNKEQLSKFRDYENSLVGLSKEVQSMLLHPSFNFDGDPFSILNVDNFSIKDLEKIMQNIEKERKLGFEYKKKKNI